MADAKIDVDLKRAHQKLSKENFDRGRFAMAGQMLIDMDPYIPLKSGPLRVSGRVEALGEAVSYNTVYARAQFYGSNGIVNFNNYTTPGTGPRWDEEAKSNHMSSWVDKFIEGARLNE